MKIHAGKKIAYLLPNNSNTLEQHNILSCRASNSSHLRIKYNTSGFSNNDSTACHIPDKKEETVSNVSNGFT